MARYLGSKHRLCRRIGEKLCDSAKCPVVRRDFPPGVHGPKGRNTKLTAYALEVLEKQKAKRIYGILERQFVNYFKRAVRRVGNTSTFLGQILERRLDNVVFRLGLARTRTQARQLVTHGHVLVNGRRVNIPSYQVRIGDCVSMHEKSAQREKFTTERTGEKRDLPGWLAFDDGKKEGKVASLPEADQFPQSINYKLIIEHYSR